jgi:hypothetical protein
MQPQVLQIELQDGRIITNFMFGNAESRDFTISRSVIVFKRKDRDAPFGPSGLAVPLPEGVKARIGSN